MSEILYIRFLSSLPPIKTEWTLTDNSGSILSSSDSPVDIEHISTTLQLTGKKHLPKIILLVPGEDVLLTSVSIPSSNERQIRQALPYATEEQLADEIDNMHIAIGPQVESNLYAVACVKRDIMNIWLKTLEQANLFPETIISEINALPHADSSWHILIDTNKAICSAGATMGLCSEIRSIDTSIESLLETLDPNKLQDIVCWTPDALSDKQHILLERISRHIAAHKEAQINIQPITSSTHHLIDSLRKAEKSYIINLLQGPYRSKSSHEDTAKWSSLLTTLGIWFVLILSFDLGKALYLNYKAQQYNDKSIALYKELFPNDTKIINPKLQMANHLNNSAQGYSNSGFLGIFASVSNQIKTFSSRAKLIIQEVHFNAEKGDLILIINATQIDLLDAFRDHLSKISIAAELTSAKTGQNGAIGEFRIRGGSI